MRAYQPSQFYGFDPHPDFREMTFLTAGTKLVLRRTAAWLYDGEVGFEAHDTGSRLGDGEMVPCFDFSGWLPTIGTDEFVVKMDIEGSEYELLDWMLEEGTDKLVSEFLIEWHGDPRKREDYLDRLTCPVKEWWL
jgi:FkbM family methyltransferase